MNTATTPQPPFLTNDDIENEIVDRCFFTAAQGMAGSSEGTPPADPTPYQHVMFCVLLLRNGTKVTGVNTGPLNPANYSEVRARDGALADAKNKVWELMGYAVRQTRFDNSCKVNPDAGR